MAKINHQKHLHNIATYTAKRALLVSIAGITNIVHTYSHQGNKPQLKSSHIHAMMAVPLSWKILCYVLCRDNQGKHYFRHMTPVLPYPMKHNQIEKSLGKQHYDYMLEDFNHGHILTMAWIATVGDYPSDELAEKIFNELDGWNLDTITILESGVQINPR